MGFRDIALIGFTSFSISFIACNIYSSYRKTPFKFQKLIDCPYCNEQLVISYAGL